VPGAVEPIERIARRQPNSASISTALRASRKPKKPRNACTYPRRVVWLTPRLTSAAITRSASCSVISHAGLPASARNRSSTPVPLSIVI
jgi:hypothetical protein